MKLKSEFATVFLVNLVDEKGNPSWGERFTREDIRVIRSDWDYFQFQREFMNNPIEEGKLFKAEWIRFRKARKLSDYPVLLGHWDLSYKKEGDFKAMALVGFDEQGLIVLDVFCRQCDIADAAKYHFNLVRRIRSEGAGAMFFYDATAAQEEVFSPVFQQEAFRQKIFELPIPDRTTMADKFLRIEATLTNVFFNKTLSFAEHLKNLEDYKTGEQQILSFEKGSKTHDDFPDTLEAAVRLMTKLAYTASGDGGSKPIIGKHKRKGY